MYSIKNVVERVGDAEHEYGAVRFLMSSIRAQAVRASYSEGFICERWQYVF